MCAHRVTCMLFFRNFGQNTSDSLFQAISFVCVSTGKWSCIEAGHIFTRPKPFLPDICPCPANMVQLQLNDVRPRDQLTAVRSLYRQVKQTKCIRCYFNIFIFFYLLIIIHYQKKEFCMLSLDKAWKSVKTDRVFSLYKQRMRIPFIIMRSTNTSSHL